MERPSQCHVAIVGGGPAGLASAVALAREGLSSHVIERTDYDTPRVGEHLAPGVKPLLESLGLARVLKDGIHLSCPGVRSVWGSKEIIDKDYLFNRHGEGVTLSRPAFDEALASHAASLGVTLTSGSKISNLSRSGSGWDVGYVRHGEERTVKADFLIDATGRAASIAKRLGARPLVFDDLVGVAARVAPVGEDRRVYIEALESGWWYSAKLVGDQLIAVFMTDADLFDRGAGRSAAWDNMVAGSTLTRARLHPERRAAVPSVRTARTQCLDQVEGEDWLAVGDAAMSYDPLSSEGIAKGLEWGSKGARTVAASLRGDRAAGKAYAQAAMRTFTSYLDERRRFYDMEKRWRGSPFWRRRQQSAGLRLT